MTERSTCSLLLTCLSVSLGASCGDEADPIHADQAPITVAPSDRSPVDASTPPACTAGALDAGALHDASTQLADASAGDASTPFVALPVVDVRTAGSHCAGQTARSVIAPDGRSFTVGFDDLSVSGAPADGNAFCRIAVDVAAPKGKSFALAAFEAKGSAELPRGASARVQIVTDFTGAGIDPSKEAITTLVGPLRGPLDLDLTFMNSQLRFSRCDASPGGAGLRFRLLLQGAAERNSGVAITQLGNFRFVQRDCP
ncbi:MAG: DUF4360 domain-containing protein [Polyangiales bacterium]